MNDVDHVLGIRATRSVPKNEKPCDHCWWLRRRCCGDAGDPRSQAETSSARPASCAVIAEDAIAAIKESAFQERIRDAAVSLSPAREPVASSESPIQSTSLIGIVRRFGGS
jgi:hypothetical protein